MNRTEHSAKKRTANRGVFAPLANLLRSKGTRAPSRHPRLLALVATALLASLVLGVSLATAATPPTQTINPATEVAYATAHVSGAVNPNSSGVAFPVYFEYKEPSAGSWGFTFAGEVSEAEATGSSPIPFSVELTGLKAGTQYEVRLTTVFEGERFSPEPNPKFTTKPVAAPTVAIAPVAAITGTTAQFAGEINPNAPEGAPTSAAVEAGFRVSWHFQCTPACPGLNGELAADNAGHEVTAEATDLTPGISYSVSLIAENAAGPDAAVTAGPEAFATPAVAPVIASTSASGVSATAAYLNAQINPGGASTSYRFEYVTDEQFNTGGFAAASTTPETALGSGNADLHAFAQITGLTPQTTYHYRVLATNSVEAVIGPQREMTTGTIPNGGPDACPNALLRAESNSTALPDCRAYEQVSPSDKEGGFVNEELTFIPPGGDSAYFQSPQAFAGEPTNYLFFNMYGATRTVDGWQTAPLNPAQGSGDGDPTQSPPAFEAKAFASEDPLQPFIDTTFDLNPSDQDGNRIDVYRPGPAGSFAWSSRPEVSPKTTPTASFYAGSSPSGNTVLWQATSPLAANDTHQFGEELYATSGTHSELVGLLPGNVIPKCGAMLGDGIDSEEANRTDGQNANGGETRNTVSPDASQIIFESPDAGASEAFEFGLGEPSLDPSCEVPRQVYVRLDGTHTVEVSASQRTVPDPAGEQPSYYLGASLDGTRIFFVSAQELTNDDTTHSLELYEYNTGSGALTRVSSGDSGGAEGNVDGVLAISHSGERIYFAAHGQPLAPGAVEGEESVYLYENGQTSLVSAVPDALNVGDVSVPKLSFADPVRSGPGFRVTDTTSDGRVLTFLSAADLTGQNLTGQRELYRFDAVSSSLTCVSCDPNTAEPTGDAAVPVSGSNSRPQVNLMDEGGSRVIFQTTSALVPTDVNRATDVYEWEQPGTGTCVSGGTGYSAALGGCQYLITDGVSSFGSVLAGVSADAVNVFFTSWARLSPSDTDSSRDLYDARVGGGFARSPQTVGCEGESCQGPLASTAAPQSPASAAFRGPLNHRRRHHHRHHHRHQAQRNLGGQR
ncbi:MAG: hypothetical protein H0X42_09595 [Solirubrobacterales bacterium]|nr:hypothetical protein [Solirubrobacterales bacterium]